MEILVEKEKLNGVQPKEMKEYYKVFIVGNSGKGKTYSMRNLDKERTVFINIENKPLPFKGNFKYHERPVNYQDAFKLLVKYGQDPNIDTIVIDSFSGYMDRALFEARKMKKG